jgi:hypothetical protein
MPRRRRDLWPTLDDLDNRCLLSGYVPIQAGGYTPAQITSAYGLNAVALTASGHTSNGDGSGQTIALIVVGHDPNIQSDLATFDSRFGLPAPPNFTVIDQSGGQIDSGWTLEESLDVEWAHAIAPGAGILVVEAAVGWTATQQFQNLIAAVQAASTTPGVTVVSMSWGFSEFPTETAYDSNFSTPGITYIAASGDSAGVDYPAASPDVLAVGGTTLDLDRTGAIVSESAWPDSGGGYSRYEPEPGYQRSVQSTAKRSTPDVAFDGDPNTGVLVYETSARAAQGSWHVVAGTSLGAPAWAGIIAIVDQGRALAGKASLTGGTQTLPSLYALPSADFHTVTAPSPTPPTYTGGFPGPGFGWWYWDGNPGRLTTPGASANTSTGLGSPGGPALLYDLAASTITAPSPTPSPAPAPSPSPTPVPTPIPKPNKHKHHVPRRHAHVVAPAPKHATKSHPGHPKQKVKVPKHRPRS